MATRAIVKRLELIVKPITIGCFTLTAIGLEVRGRPSFHEYEGVGDFIKRAHHASGFWLGDWLRYGDTREDWRERLAQAQHVTGLSEKTLMNVRSVARAVAVPVRRDDLEFALHEVVAALEPEEQREWLERAAVEGWGIRDLRLSIRSAKRRAVIEGQAVLEGLYRVVYADPPWLYNDRPPSGSGAQQHFDGMPIAEICKLPVAAHTTPNAVLFLWTTSPMLYANPGPREVIEAWGFKYKASQIWDKVLPAGGNYFAIRHELLLICTRGSCTPDHPVPMPTSIITERRDVNAIHSSKPASFRQQIEKMYEGPYLELFGRDPVAGWTVFGNDAALWAREARDHDEREGAGDRRAVEGVSGAMDLESRGAARVH